STTLPCASMVTSTMTSPSTPAGRSERYTGGSGKTSGSAGMTSSPVIGAPGTRPYGEPPRAVSSAALLTAIGFGCGFCRLALGGCGLLASDASNDGFGCSGEESSRSGPTGARYTMESEPDDPRSPRSTSDGATNMGAAG